MAASPTSSSTDMRLLVSPYYLHPSDNTGQAQSPILLNGANYERWAKLLLNSLKAKRKQGFIDGTLKRPVNKPEEEEKWDMVNSMIIGWIYSSIEPKLRPSVSLVDSAKAMWGSLQRRFSVSDDTRIHQLHADIASCKQNGDVVEVYFGRLKVLWDDLADLDKGFSCCCGDSECASMTKYEKKEEKIRVHQFLMGLDNSRFGITRSNLLSRQTDLNLESVYSQIIQEERHLNVMRHEETTPVLGMSTTMQSPQPSQQSLTNAQAAATRVARNNSVCSHCGKQGHEVSQCFQVIGYPEWWGDQNAKPTTGRGTDRGGRGRGRDTQGGRGRGGRGSGFRAYNTNVDNSGSSTTQAPGIPNLTDEQWDTLTKFVSAQKSAANEKLMGPRLEDFDWCG
ncbi:uncharacterized protein LOC130509183 [Raphanus sativus]|uniref:Uncharacterized protein LOC130509183 n=1 Tax=Raphanus sativus TaxID=3726 RepID=A0A9W3DB14_RAPSA|nr:uncharacterized protein LOC130509183 [Raphanus sativus]